ncbi:MAG: class I SAM-dependent methyltransferase [Thermodesulfovibrio sp.]|nr:class I SAM-dependent methyltransferase [Thermodesulfovibrio sp.]
MPVCPSCETSVLEESYLETYTAPFNNQEYKLYHCLKCDLHWWEPLEIVPEFYEQEGEEDYAILHMGIDRPIGENHKMFFKHVPLKSGRLLDVGCGDGVFLVEAQKRGYEVWGIDFDRKSIQVCQEKRGLKNTFAMTPWEFAEFCQKENLKFDIITFFEVLEHQDKPREFLEAVKNMLKPGGWIAGSVPNVNIDRMGGIYRKIYRYMHRHDLPPNHLLRFSINALKKILEHAGFNQVILEPTKSDLRSLASLYQKALLDDSINKKVSYYIKNSKFQRYAKTKY